MKKQNKEYLSEISEKTKIENQCSTKPRKGWDIAFVDMAKNEDDKLLINDVLEDENFEEWI